MKEQELQQQRNTWSSGCRSGCRSKHGANSSRKLAKLQCGACLFVRSLRCLPLGGHVHLLLAVLDGLAAAWFRHAACRVRQGLSACQPGWLMLDLVSMQLAGGHGCPGLCYTADPAATAPSRQVASTCRLLPGGHH